MGRCTFLFSLSLLVSFHVTSLNAQLSTGWKAHDMSRPVPAVVDPGPSPAAANVPGDAIVLFNGSDLSNWRDDKGGEAKWKVVDRAMESVAGSGYVFTKQEFGDCQLHVEWASPSKVVGDSQGRGNSGIYLMGRFEIQVLDSYENKTYADGSAASIYGQYPPLVNACRKPGEWQTYDIVFHRPRFDDAGKLASAARVTVFHNGILVQDNSEIIGPSNWIQHDEYQPGKETASLSLQDHGNPVRYRNIWIRPLADERPRPATPYASETGLITLDDAAKEKLVGEYKGFKVVNRDGVLYLNHLGRQLEMMPLSAVKFEFRKSAGSVEFSQDESGNIVSAKVHMDAAGTRAGKKK